MIVLAAPARTRAQLTVDLGVIAQNVRTIVATTSTPVCAVVKADGFGHGAQQVARTALAHGATSLGVATIDEAIDLRRATDAPILAWLSGPGSDFEGALRAGIQLAVLSAEHLAAVTAAARRTRTTARIHLHVDTGMARDGAPREHWLALAAAARRAERRHDIDVIGLMSHLAGGGLHRATDEAVRRFTEAETVVRSVGLRPTTRHLAATHAAMTDPTTRFDLCRIGAGLYGIGEHLREALTLTAPVVTVRDVPAGTPVGYGGTYVTERATRLALVPLGYGDGIPRLASHQGEVEVRGRRRRLAGTVSMDQLVVDVGDLAVEPGETVTLFGGGSAPTVADWATWSQTIPHEVMTGLGARIQRSFL